MSLLEPNQTILQLLRDSLPEGSAEGADASPGTEEILSYVAFLAAGLAQENEFDAAVWKDVLQPYLDQTGQGDAVVETFREAAEREFVEIDDAESYGSDDGEAEVLCDLRFNLAYGGKILLHQTKLKLVRGKKYALVGQNGVGKTTLLNAIHR